MARVALLIGTGQYLEGLKPLPAAPKDVEAIAAVLNDPEMGGFDQVQSLIDKPFAEIAETIETWFRERQRDDLALLYISGHGVKDAQSDLYFAACNTRKQKEELVRSTAVAASFVRDRIRESKAKRQIIILDCCFSGAFGDLLSKDDDTINLEGLLGAEGRVVLTSSSSIQYSFEQRDGSLSIYTRYLVEGIRTGAADVDNDGAISVQELHDYAKRKVQEESPAMTPRIIVLKDEAYQIRIAKAPLGDPKVKYRKEVEAIIQEDGDTIDEILSRPVLEELQFKLGLTDEDVQTIETEILEPIRQRQAKIQRYQEVFTRFIQHKNSLGERERKRLKQLQKFLGLLDENVLSFEDEIITKSPTLVTNQPETFPNFLEYVEHTKQEQGYQEELVKCRIIAELLPVVDNFELARAQIKTQTNTELLIHKAYQGIYKDLVDRLKGIGISPLPIAIGQIFDSNLHEVVEYELTKDYPEGTVIEELVRGFKLGNLVVRKTSVRISRNPSPA